MMWGLGYGQMMNWGPGFAVFGVIAAVFWLVVLIDVILLGVWLWKQIQKR